MTTLTYDTSSLRRLLISDCLLLLLWENPQHGYELVERLKVLGSVWDSRSGFIYHQLKKLEEQGLVQGMLEIQKSGPARRVYATTPAGLGRIQQSAIGMEEIRDVVSTWLDHFRASSAVASIERE